MLDRIVASAKEAQPQVRRSGIRRAERQLLDAPGASRLTTRMMKRRRRAERIGLHREKSSALGILEPCRGGRGIGIGIGCGSESGRGGAGLVKARIAAQKSGDSARHDNAGCDAQRTAAGGEEPVRV